ncbi:MAG: M1 family metallopeptidase [Anaerolineales bacterium]|nr:M1 family metallopeptidase [Anaerolineales bacterium]
MKPFRFPFLRRPAHQATGLFALFLISCLIFGGCTPAVPGIVTVTPVSPPPPATSTPLPPPSPFIEQTALPALATPLLPPEPPPSLTPDTSTPATPPDLSTSLQDITYHIEVLFDYDNKTLLADQKITFTNRSGRPLETLTLAVEPNRRGGIFRIERLGVDGVTLTNYTLDRHRLTFIPPVPIPNGASAQIELNYLLVLPLIEQGDPNLVRPQIFGYTSRQVNLTDWYPMLVPFDPTSGWLLPDPWYYGEHLTYPLADFDIRLQFTDPAKAPLVAAGGAAEAGDALTRYTLENGRTFAFAMGQTMKSLSGEVNGVIVTSYFFPGFETPGQAVLETTLKAVKTYTELFGPYPHRTLTAVQGDFNDGMEFDSLYYLSNAFYNLYDRTPNNYLVMVAAHETCHAWWFGAVANDQANHPWLDEALTTYCERLFYEKNYPQSLAWWQSARIDFFQPEGKIDGNVPGYGGFTPYTNATYRQGARFLHELRERIGDEAFFAFLKDYYAQMNGKIARPADFFSILPTHAPVNYSDIVTKYFSNPPVP